MLPYDCIVVAISWWFVQGMDELTPMGSADVIEVTQSNINRYCLEPKDLGISR